MSNAGRQRGRNTMISDFDEAHLQSLVSSLGKKQRFPEQSGLQYVKDPQSRGRSLFFKKKTPHSCALQRRFKTFCGFCAATVQGSGPLWCCCTHGTSQEMIFCPWCKLTTAALLTSYSMLVSTPCACFQNHFLSLHSKHFMSLQSSSWSSWHSRLILEHWILMRSGIISIAQ